MDWVYSAAVAVAVTSALTIISVKGWLGYLLMAVTVIAATVLVTLMAHDIIFGV
jgi:hypothetical protein